MINWRLRFQNKTTLVALIVGIIALVYQVLNTFGIIPKIEQQQIVNIAMAIIDLLCLAGIIVDPTTAGIGDSERALSYDKPSTDSKPDKSNI